MITVWSDHNGATPSFASSSSSSSASSTSTTTTTTMYTNSLLSILTLPLLALLGNSNQFCGVAFVDGLVSLSTTTTTTTRSSSSSSSTISFSAHALSLPQQGRGNSYNKAPSPLSSRPKSLALYSSSSSSTNPSSTPSVAGAAAGGDVAADDEELEFVDGRKPSQDWELDCYSRPVVGVGGKKLWEVLLTDSSGSFRYRKTLPSNQVNSKELRKTVEELMDDPRISTKPSTIRFFRGAMFNSTWFLKNAKGKGFVWLYIRTRVCLSER